MAVEATTAYDDLAEGWDARAGLVYAPLARALVAASPVSLSGRLVLDVGSGTGVAAAAARAAGARVVAADRSWGMITRQGRRWPTAVGDTLALPYRRGSLGVVLAGFLLNHLPPGFALAEMACVLEPGGLVLSSTWAGGGPDPAKAAIDAVLTAWGWKPPQWYRVMKTEHEPVSGDPERLAEAARQAGFVDIDSAVHHIDTGVDSPRPLVDYRLATPHIAGWVAALDEAGRTELIRQATAAVAPFVDRWRPSVVLLAGRTPAHPSLRAAARSRAPA